MINNDYPLVMTITVCYCNSNLKSREFFRQNGDFPCVELPEGSVRVSACMHMYIVYIEINNETCECYISANFR